MKKMANNYLKGIDISEFNGDIDFMKVKDEVDFIMIRATFGRFGIDNKFEQNVKGCITHNIPFGLYFYSYATDEEKGIEETKFFLERIKPYKDKITFPCVIDMEDSDSYKQNHGNPSKEILTNICVKACELIKQERLIACVYANKDWFQNRIDKAKLTSCYLWLAWWNNDLEATINKFGKEFSLVQYTSKGQIKGIKGFVDMNYSLVDFIKAKQYLENISKINFIKLQTGLEDITIQFLSCYKFGQDLINKIYERLLKEKSVRKDNPKMEKEVQKEYGFETKTIIFLSNYLYGEELITKLYLACTK